MNILKTANWVTSQMLPFALLKAARIRLQKARDVKEIHRIWSFEFTGIQGCGRHFWGRFSDPSGRCRLFRFRKLVAFEALKWSLSCLALLPRTGARASDHKELLQNQSYGSFHTFY